MKKRVRRTFERESEAVDDGAQHFEQLGDAVVSLRLVHEAVEDVRHQTAHRRSCSDKLAVQPMQQLFQQVAFARIFTVEQLDQLRERERVRQKRLNNTLAHSIKLEGK